MDRGRKHMILLKKNPCNDFYLGQDVRATDHSIPVLRSNKGEYFFVSFFINYYISVSICWLSSKAKWLQLGID